MTEEKTTGQPGPLTPDRSAVPDSKEVVTSDAASPVPGPDETHPHKHTNSVAGLTSPEVEPKAPGRTTHGATNNR